MTEVWRECPFAEKEGRNTRDCVARFGAVVNVEGDCVPCPIPGRLDRVTVVILPSYPGGVNPQSLGGEDEGEQVTLDQKAVQTLIVSWRHSACDSSYAAVLAEIRRCCRGEE